jgi:hypothetical protein
MLLKEVMSHGVTLWLAAEIRELEEGKSGLVYLSYSE